MVLISVLCPHCHSDPALVLKISPTTVINTLKKRP
jgi:glutaredoxin